MRSEAWGPWAGVAIVYIAAACFAGLFAFVLILGLAALGFETGWWPGDSNMKDGEGVSTTVAGLGLLAALSAIAGWGARRCLDLTESPRARRWLPPVASSVLFIGAVALSLIAVLVSY